MRLFSAFVLLSLIGHIATSEDEEKLFEQLISKYRKEIRPAKNYLEPSNVTFGFSLHQVIDVDERNQMITTSCWLNINWIDIKLTWNPLDHNQLKLMHIPHMRIWKPDISLSNNADPAYKNVQQKRLERTYSCCPDEVWPYVQIKIHLRRRPLYYVFNQIMPCVLISSMALLGFLIPADTGEKVTMCITTMLSMGVFLKTINESMPPTSDNVPLIAMYYGMSLFLVCIATLANVMTLKLHYTGHRHVPSPIPPWTRVLVLGFMAKMLFVTVEPPEKILERVSRSSTHKTPQDGNNKSNVTSPIKRSMSNHNTVICLSSSQEFTSGVSIIQNASGEHVVAPPILNRDNSIEMPTPTGNHVAPVQKPEMVTYSPTFDTLSNKPRYYRPPRMRSSFQETTPAKAQQEDISPKKPNVEYDAQLAAVIQLRSEFENRFCKVLNRVYQTMEQNETRLDIQEKRNKISHEWKQLGIIIDRLFLWLFIIATSMTLLLIMVQPALEQYFAGLRIR